MKLYWVILGVILLLLIGPFRRQAFGKKRFTLTVSMIIGAIVGLVYIYKSSAFNSGIPGLPLLLILFAACTLGGGVKEFLDEILDNHKEK